MPPCVRALPETLRAGYMGRVRNSSRLGGLKDPINDDR
jgi:hypothetical protein